MGDTSDPTPDHYNHDNGNPAESNAYDGWTVKMGYDSYGNDISGQNMNIQDCLHAC